MTFKVTPKPEHKESEAIGGAFVSFWIVTDSSEEADQHAKDYLSENLWIIDSTEKEVVEITEEHYVDIDQEIGLAHYNKAQETGFSAAFSKWMK